LFEETFFTPIIPKELLIVLILLESLLKCYPYNWIDIIKYYTLLHASQLRKEGKTFSTKH